MKIWWALFRANPVWFVWWKIKESRPGTWWREFLCRRIGHRKVDRFSGVRCGRCQKLLEDRGGRRFNVQVSSSDKNLPGGTGSRSPPNQGGPSHLD